MKTEKVTRFHPSGFFVLRTPLLPFEQFLEWGDGLEAPAAINDPVRFERAYAADRALLRERLQSIVTQPLLRDALFVASPNIIERFHLWTDDPDSERGHKVEHVLVRYFSRMAGRATPFGLFAGCSVGTIGNQTHLMIAGRDEYQRHTRLDMDYLDALVALLSNQPESRNLFRYRPNSSLYRAAGRVRYVESRSREKLRSYHLVAVEDTDYLAATLERARDGATVESLGAALVNEDTSLDEAREYIIELIESQILLPDVALSVTGPEPIHSLIEALGRHEVTAAAAGTLESTRAELEAIDEVGPGVEPERYLYLARQLETLGAKVELSRLFQVDMTKPAPDATLGTAALAELMRGVDVLQRLAPNTETGSLKQFREAFVARYETREVPLVEALDEEIGIGFVASEETSPLLKDLMFPSPAESSSALNERRHQLLLRKLSEAMQSGASEIALAPEDLEAISEKDPQPLPDAFAVTARLSAASQTALDDGEFRLFIENIAGPPGAVLFGRFCHADEALHKYVLTHLREEESLRSDAIFAEIVHLPEGRIGNVIARPVLREYEIPYLGCSGAKADRQIPVTDLFVSIRAGRIRLRSARLDREIIPRLTNMHNYSWNGLGVYQFLCLLAQQGVAGALNWNWGALKVAPFLPRVTLGRLVLALARWNVGKDELRALGQQRGAARYQAIQNWRDERGLPRLVALADADNLLPIDFDNALSVESFIQLVKERDAVTLIELFPALDQLCARGPEGSFTHELVVPFVRTSGVGGQVPGAGEKQKHPGRDAGTRRRGDAARNEGPGAEPELLSPRPRVPVSPRPRVPVSPRPRVPVSPRLDVPVSPRLDVPVSRRRFIPGSEWLYVKLYTGTATADALLRDIVRPLTESLLQSGLADSWFFIRYGDPEWHLRLRFHGEPERLHHEVMPTLNATIAPLLDGGLVWRMQLDTYEREVERYGGAEGVVLAESLFYADSEAVLEIVEMLEPGDAGADERWRLAVRGIDQLLTDFRFDLPAKHAVLKRVREAYFGEHRVDKDLTSQLSAKFRKEHRSLEELLVADADGEHPLAPGVAALARRSESLVPIVEGLNSIAKLGRLSIPLPELLPPYIHMHANRVLRSAHRHQEAVIYDFLVRLYESQIARAR